MANHTLVSDTPFIHAHSHDHDHCIERALQSAKLICERRHLRFTPIRKRVLELVWSSHAPVAAYQLLKTLREDKKNAEAPTVYRALDFLQQYGMVHKIESLNAYVGCDHPEEAHTGQFLICTECRQVEEQQDSGVNRAIARQASKSHFNITGQVIEIKGVCAGCQK